MPSPADDKYFGPKRGSARKAWLGLVKQYGLAKGEQVYFALLNERRKARKTYGRTR